jgi:parallel beta-helix repeat protein
VFGQGNPIQIKGNSGFSSSGVVASGNGSLSNPYVIHNLDITNASGAAIEISKTTDDFLIQNVLLEHSKYGMFFTNVTNGIVENSTLYENGVGVLLLSSQHDILFNNNFIQNTIQANDTLGSMNYWDNGYEDGDNYWSERSAL